MTSRTLVAAIAIIVLSIVVFNHLSDMRLRVANEAPMVPSFVPVLKSALAFSQNPHGFLSGCRAKYGEIFTVRLGPKRVTFLCDPRSYPALFKNKQLSFAAVASDISMAVFKQTPAAVGDAALDKIVHQQYAKHLSGDGLQELTVKSYTMIREWMRTDIARVKSGQQSTERGLWRLINDVIFDVGVKSVYGEGLNTDNLQKLYETFDAAFPLLVGKAPSFATKEAVNALQQMIKRFSSFEVREGESSLIAARRTAFKESGLVNDYDHGSLQSAMLWAAVANTIPAAFFTFAYLLKHPDALEQVRAELNEHLPYVPLEAGDDQPWTREQCAKLKLTDSAMSEALRLATGSMVIREAVEPTTLTMNDGQTIGIRKGDSVAIYPALTHLDSRVFSNPEQFQVDRFLNGEQRELDGQKLTTAFLPFGAGVSMCPGRYWAKNEVLMILALLLQHADLSVPKDEPIPPFDTSRVGIGVYPPKGDMKVHLSYSK